MNIVKLEINNSVAANSDKNIKNNLYIKKNFIFFSKLELTCILNLYSKQVSKGFWRDYALDSKIDNAIFSIYKYSHDIPL